MTNPVFIGCDHIIDLDKGWEYTALNPGQATAPREVAGLTIKWLPATVPGTVAGSEHLAGTFAYGRIDYDQNEYWYRANIEIPDASFIRLHFAGLATFADVFLDDEHILQSTNMFDSHTVAIPINKRTATLWIRFHSLHDQLATKRPRPRWRTKLVVNQQLRWIRTTLLGRIPGWSPPVAPVGPWRDIKILVNNTILIDDLDIQSHIDPSGSNGTITVNLNCESIQRGKLQEIILRADNYAEKTIISPIDSVKWRSSCTLNVSAPTLWWPHTHGSPDLVKLSLNIKINDQWFDYDLGHTGFRKLLVDENHGNFAVQVNGTRVFCRGACWTPIDVINFSVSKERLRNSLLMVRDAGMNMLRLVGSMIYECDDFYEICDELGIMVWQDFMFSNLDYPLTDTQFLDGVKKEIATFLTRTQNSPCLTIICGNSDVEQQTAMLGLPAEMWRPAFFADNLPSIINAYRLDVAYIPSSPSGGNLPFQVDQSVSHYYGVGAYLRPLSDARTANVRFAAECLGFANVPDDRAISALMSDGAAPPTHPKWKERVPRDGGAAWDFEDIRDHYSAVLFDIDPLTLRYTDLERYLEVARITSGEVMYRTIAEWRRLGSTCQGAIIWWLQDLWLGSGWGVIDANGIPKAAYHFVRRAMAPIAIFITDEGLNGLDIHAVNDTGTEQVGLLELTFLRNGNIITGSFSTELRVGAHSALKIRDSAVVGYFNDSSYAYRFGAAPHHMVCARWLKADGLTALSETCIFPAGLTLPDNNTIKIVSNLTCATDGLWTLEVSADSFAQFVMVDVPGFGLSDNYFHLMPNCVKSLRLFPISGANEPKGKIKALNCPSSFPIKKIV